VAWKVTKFVVPKVGRIALKVTERAAAASTKTGEVVIEGAKTLSEPSAMKEGFARLLIRSIFGG
jgi:hypothetical protein